MKIIWCMVPEIWSVTEFFLILDDFLAFYPLKKQKIKILKKKKKKPGYIILHNCTLNDNHMMYGSWDMKPNRQNIFIILDILPFYNPKTQNFEKMKKTPGDISSFLSFYTGVPEIMIMCYKIPEIWREVIFIFHFGLFFSFYPPNSPKNHNFKKVKIYFIILHMCTKNYDQMIYSSWDPVRDGWSERQMDGWKDRQKDRWMTERQTDGRKDRQTNGQTEGWTDRLMDGQMENGQMDGRTDRRTHRQMEKVIHRGRCPIKNCLQFQEIKCSSCVQIKNIEKKKLIQINP